MVLGYVLGLDVVLGGALCFGFRVVLWIIAWDLGGAWILSCALGFGVVLGGASCFGLYLGFRRGIW